MVSSKVREKKRAAAKALYRDSRRTKANGGSWVVALPIKKKLGSDPCNKDGAGRDSRSSGI